MNRMLKIYMVLLILVLSSCVARAAKRGDIPAKNQGVVLIYLDLQGRDSALVKVVKKSTAAEIGMGLADGIIDFGSGKNLYVLFLNPKEYVFTDFIYGQALEDILTPVLPLDPNDNSKHLTLPYCGSFKVNQGQVTFAGALSFNVREKGFYLSCDNSDSTAIAAFNVFKKEHSQLHNWLQMSE